MTIDELRDAMVAVRPVHQVAGELTPQRLSDALRFQAGRGLVRRVGRGRYEAVPSSMSRTTQWRYRRWDQRFDDLTGQQR